MTSQGPQSDAPAASGESRGHVQEWAEMVEPIAKETVMKLSSLLLAGLGAAALTAVVLLILGVSFRRPLPTQGAGLYNRATETTVTGVVSEVLDFSCPVSEGEMGDHLVLKTAEGEVMVHLAPGRVMRSQKLRFAPGEQLTVTGSRVRITGHNDLIAREIVRGLDDYVIRDQAGKLMLVQ
jgi:hypothetical protein